MRLVVGLGNPGDEYTNTRHNAGRIIVGFLAPKLQNKKVKFFTPDTFMNKSGSAIAPLVKTKKDLADLVVLYDDIDLPLGKMKISFNRSSGGHRGLQSIIRALKSEEFLRIRIGIATTTPSGKIKKPKGEKQVINFILGEFKKNELEVLKKISRKVNEALEMIFDEGKNKAMSVFN